MPSYKIAMIGDDSTVSGFRAAGVLGFPVYDSAQALDELKRMAQSGKYAIIFITENLASPILADISRIPTGTVPAIIVIPDQGGARGIGFAKIRGAVEKALGIDLLGKELQTSMRAEPGREKEDGRKDR
jgi:V/A-type H+-transporting ATPase subunit F